MINYKVSIPVLFLAIVVFLGGCSKSETNKKANELEIQIVRFEKELFNNNLYSLSDSSYNLLEKYPAFTALYASRIIEIGDTTAPYFGNNIKQFITDQAIYNMNKRVNEVFADFTPYADQITAGLNNYHNEFPNKKVPVVYTFVSGLNQSIVVADELLGISLDKYLGEDEEIYDRVYPVIPQYLRVTMEPAYIASDAIKSWVASDIGYEPLQDNFISRVLHDARSMYISKQILPEISDTILWGFTREQMEFCVNNEDEMWKYLIEQKLLFETDNFRINQFVAPGPFTKDFTKDSPARAAVWVGYRMINDFMNRKKDLTLDELAKINDFQVILNESKYNP